MAKISNYQEFSNAFERRRSVAVTKPSAFNVPHAHRPSGNYCGFLPHKSIMPVIIKCMHGNGWRGFPHKNIYFVCLQIANPNHIKISQHLLLQWYQQTERNSADNQFFDHAYTTGVYVDLRWDSACWRLFEVPTAILLDINITFTTAWVWRSAVTFYEHQAYLMHTKSKSLRAAFVARSGTSGKEMK